MLGKWSQQELDEFLYVSEAMERLFSGGEDVPRFLFIWGVGLSGYVSDWSHDIFTAALLIAPVEFRAWKNEPDRTAVCPTAHDCGAAMIEAMRPVVFPDNPDLGSMTPADEFAKRLNSFCKKHRKKLESRMASWAQQIDPTEWRRLVARLKIERNAIKRHGPPANIPDNIPDNSRKKKRKELPDDPLVLQVANYIKSTPHIAGSRIQKVRIFLRENNHDAALDASIDKQLYRYRQALKLT